MCHNIFNVICHQNIYFISPETTPELFCAIKRYRWDIELHLPAPFTLCPVGTMQNGGTKECRNGYLGSKSGSNIRPKCSNSVLCCGEKLVGWNQTFSWTHWVYGLHGKSVSLSLLPVCLLRIPPACLWGCQLLLGAPTFLKEEDTFIFLLII